MIKLTKEQQFVHNSIIDWINNFDRSNQKQWISFSGLAGTGKSTLVGFIARTIKEEHYKNIAYATYTGKASIVLRNKIELHDGDFVGTIHSLIYKPVIDKNGNVTHWALKSDIDQDIIFIDEGSMVGKDIWDDLLKFNVPIIVSGDHGQLPPIGSKNFSLMKKPDLILKQIHRQALDNPIIKISYIARKYGEVPIKIFGNNTAKLDWYDNKTKKILYNFDLKTDTQILCGMNRTRVKLNELIRYEVLGYDRYEPNKDERVICLINDRKQNVMNGLIGSVIDTKIINDNIIDLNIRFDGSSNDQKIYSHRKGFLQINHDTLIDETFKPVLKNSFEPTDGRIKKVNVFDYGYCISVHKSQGSEFEKVILIDERNNFQTDDDYAKWLYTGITRARNKLLIITNF